MSLISRSPVVPNDATMSAKIAVAEEKERRQKNVALAGKMQHKYLLRDDGTIYPWNEKRAGNPRFRVIGELPQTYIHAEKERRILREKQKIQMQEHRQAALERIREEKRKKYENMLAQRPSEPDPEEALKAEHDREETIIQMSDAEGLRSFVLTKWNIRIPKGDIHLMREAVINMWLSDEMFEVGEPEDWNDRKCLLNFARDKLFLNLFKGLPIDKARLKVREALDAYNNGA